jgi:uncharacterized membrane protein
MYLGDTVNQSIVLPQPHEVTRREKEDAMAAYLMNFAAWGAGLPLPSLNLLAAAIYYFINRKKSRFVGFHCFQAFTSQLPTTLLNIGAVGTFIDFVFILNRPLPHFFWPYVLFAVLMNLLYLAVSIYSCVLAAKGRIHYFLVFGRWAYAKYYGPNAISFDDTGLHKNVPPAGF